MGMFDRVWATCPSCGKHVEFQSKAGKCELIDYTPESLPPEIARALEGEIVECSGCATKVKLTLKQRPIPRVAMRVAYADESDEDDY